MVQGAQGLRVFYWGGFWYLGSMVFLFVCYVFRLWLTWDCESTRGPMVKCSTSGLPICVWGQVVAVWSRRRSPAGPSYSSMEGYCSILCKTGKHTRCLPLSSLCTSICDNFAVCNMIHMGAISRSTLSSKVCDCSWILFSMKREGRVQSVTGAQRRQAKEWAVKMSSWSGRP